MKQRAFAVYLSSIRFLFIHISSVCRHSPISVTLSNLVGASPSQRSTTTLRTWVVDSWILDTLTTPFS
jgi:hypothetical protein